MIFFQKTQQDEQRFNNFIARLDKTVDILTPYNEQIDISGIQAIKQNFINKTNDFFRKDRKLNIGVIGQVKAGKSSFLNTLLFDGKKVLPSAATPKTATLTKIEYGTDNKITIEYYTAEEWQVIEKNAESKTCESAKEIMKMVADKGIVPSEYIARGTDEFVFASPEELMEKLNDYVGENGTYTALTKNVTIYMAKEELRDISVVDTPGLNDAITSRTDRTRQFIELCDVVFFLSRASAFMDKSDLELLIAQLPQKGVKRMITVCSRFDNGLEDTIYDVDSIKEAVIETRAKLKSRAKAVIDGQKILPELAEILAPCREPVFISSMCWNMAHKDRSSFDAQEQLVLSNLNQYDDIDNDILADIGNIAAVQKIFREVVNDKDETLSRKAADFVPSAEEEYRSSVRQLKEETDKTLNILRTGDSAVLEKQKRAVVQQINGIKGSAETIFGEMLVNLEKVKIDTLQKLREISKDYGKLTEKQGTETHFVSYRVSDSKWYNPFSWGKSHIESSSYDTTYTYLDASDALENIRKFSTDACSFVDKAFTDAVDTNGTKRKLLSVIVESFDIESETYDPALLKLITAQTLNKIQFPVMEAIDISREQEKVSSQFSGEVRDGSERFQLQKLMSDMMVILLRTVAERFEGQVISFRDEIEKLKNSFVDSILKNIQDDFDKLLKQLEDKEKEIERYEELQNCLKEL